MRKANIIYKLKNSKVEGELEMEGNSVSEVIDKFNKEYGSKFTYLACFLHSKLASNEQLKSLQNPYLNESSH